MAMFMLRNRASAFAGVNPRVRIDGLSSELKDMSVETRPDQRVALIRRIGSLPNNAPPYALLGGETVNLLLQGVVNRAFDGPAGDCVLQTLREGGDVIDEATVSCGLLVPGRMAATVTLLDSILGMRGRVRVVLIPSNPIPVGGAISIWFPSPFQLDTGGLDLDGVTVAPDMSDGPQLDVRVTTTGSLIREKGLSQDLMWRVGALVSLVSNISVPASQPFSFTLRNVQYPPVPVMPGAGQATGTFQIRTLTADGAGIDANLSAVLNSFLRAGLLQKTDVQPSSLIAGAIGDLMISFTTVNIVPTDGIIEIRLPDGYSLAGDFPGPHILPNISFNLGPAGADMSVDFPVPFGSAPFVKGFGGPSVSAEVLSGLDGNFSVRALSGTGFLVYRSGGTSTPARSRIALRIFDPDAPGGQIPARVVGVRTPQVSGMTGTYVIRTRVLAGAVIDEDESVSPVLLLPGLLRMVDVRPESLISGNASALLLNFLVANPIPGDGAIIVRLPEEDLRCECTELKAAADCGDLTAPGLCSGALQASISGQTVTIRIIPTASAPLTLIYPCETPVCGTDNLAVSGSANASSNVRRAAQAFAGNSTQWRSGGGLLPQWVQFDFGRVRAVCGYSFMSRESDLLGYLASDGPIGYALQGSTDGLTWIDIHRVVNGPHWSSPQEIRNHRLSFSAAFRYYRLLVTAVPGRTSGTNYTVIRDLRLLGPTGSEWHSVDLETRCRVSLRITGPSGEGCFRNRGQSGLTHAYVVQTARGDGRVIDEDRAASPSILLPGPLGIASGLDSYLTGSSTSLWLNLTLWSDLPADGEVTITFSDGTGLDGPLSAKFSGPNWSREVVSVVVTERLVQLVRSGDWPPARHGDIIQVRLSGVRNPPSVDYRPAFVVQTRDTGDGSVIDETAVSAPPLMPRPLDCTVTLASNRAGAVGPLNLTFTIYNELPVNGRLRLLLPSEYILRGIPGLVGPGAAVGPEGLVATPVSGIDGELLAWMEGPALVLGRHNSSFPSAAGTHVTVLLYSVVNAPHSGDSGIFTLCTETSAGNYLECGVSLPLTPSKLLPGVIADASILPHAPVYTRKSGLYIVYTTANAYSVGSVIVLALNCTFSLEDAFISSFEITSEHAPVDSGLDALVSRPRSVLRASLNVSMDQCLYTRTVNITLKDPVPAHMHLRLSLGGVANPGFVGPSGAFWLWVYSPSGALVDESPAIPQIMVEPGPLSNVSIDFSSNVAGDIVSIVLRFASDRNPAVARAGAVKVLFPASFALGGVAAAWVNVAGGAAGKVITSGSVATMLVSDLLVSSPTFPASIRLDGVRNQNFSGLCGEIWIQTWNSEGLVDEGPIPGPLLVAGTLINASVVPMNTAAGGVGRLLVRFIPANPFPSDGVLAVVLPPGFVVLVDAAAAVPIGSTASQAWLTPAEYEDDIALDGQLNLTLLGGSLVIISRVNALLTVPPGVMVALYIDAVRSPPLMMADTGTFQVRTLLSVGTAVDEALSVPGVAIGPGILSLTPPAGITAAVCPPWCGGPLLLPSVPLAGASTDAQVTFTIANALPADGEFELVFPEGTFLGAVSGASAAVSAHYNAPGDKEPAPLLDGGFSTFVAGSFCPATTVLSAGLTYSARVVGGAISNEGGNHSVGINNSIGSNGGGTNLSTARPNYSETSAPMIYSSPVVGSIDLLSGPCLRVRRDGTGRAVSAAATVSIVVHGLRMRDWSGYSGAAQLRTKRADGTVVDEGRFVPGYRLSPAPFIASNITRTSVFSGVASDMVLALIPSIVLPSGAQIIVDLSGELSNFASCLDGAASGAVAPACEYVPTPAVIDQTGLQNISGPIKGGGEEVIAAVFGRSLVLTLGWGVVAAASQPVTITISGLRNPFYDRTVTYPIVAQVPVRGGIERSAASAVLALTAVPAGWSGSLTLRFVPPIALHARGMIRLFLPPSLKATTNVTARVAFGFDGDLEAVADESGVVELLRGSRRELTAALPGRLIEVEVGPLHTTLFAADASGPLDTDMLGYASGADGAGLIDLHMSGPTCLGGSVACEWSNTGAATVGYTRGLLSKVLLQLDSPAAGSVGDVKVIFKTMNPLPPLGSVQTRLPSGFSPQYNCSVRVLQGLLGAIDLTLSGNILTVLRIDAAGGLVIPGSEIVLVFGPVQNRPFAGRTEQATVVTYTADGDEIDWGAAPPLELLVARAIASVTVNNTKAGAITWADVDLVTVNPLLPEAEIVLQLAAGMTLPNLTPYGTVFVESINDGRSSFPVQLEQLPGSVAYYQTAKAPYFALNYSLAWLPLPAATACATCVLRGATVLARRIGNGNYNIVPAGSRLMLRLDGLLLRPWSGFTGTWQVCTKLGEGAGMDTGSLVDLAAEVAGWNVDPGDLVGVEVSALSLMPAVSMQMRVSMTIDTSLPPDAEVIYNGCKVCEICLLQLFLRLFCLLMTRIQCCGMLIIFFFAVPFVATRGVYQP